MTASLAVSIVCKDAVKTLPAVLDSVRGMGSVVALDSGSSDGTLELLASARAGVERVPWEGYLATKQRALEACADADWVLCLDADEPVEPDLAASIRRVLEEDPAGVAGFEVNRKIFYRGRFLEHAWQPEWRLRLVRGADVRTGASKWTGVDPHPYLGVAGRVERLAGTLRHDAFETFAQFLERQVRHARDSARALHAQGKRGRVSRLIFSPLSEFLKQAVVRGAWRDGAPGWMAAGSSAAASLLKHVMLIELSRGDDRGG
ncbi:MAG: glycosyltransferase family 2 protein [Phycisphaerae bacterium]|nr:glycosyltransferase family 2 protein [Phycisphaerae bacterium]